MKLSQKVRNYFSEELAFSHGTLNWLQHRIMERFYIRGPIQTLLIGSAGGTEAYQLRKRGNVVTAVEHDPGAKEGIESRLLRNDLLSDFECHIGAIEAFQTEKKFHFVLMSHVLEHIKDDARVIRRLSRVTEPHSRLIIATPTSLNGLPGGNCYVDPEPSGPNHVRTGYQGVELDEICRRSDFILIKRFYLGNPIVQLIWNWEAGLSRAGRLAQMVSFPLRYIVAMLCIVRVNPYVQISIYTKLPDQEVV